MHKELKDGDYHGVIMTSIILQMKVEVFLSQSVDEPQERAGELDPCRIEAGGEEPCRMMVGGQAKRGKTSGLIQFGVSISARGQIWNTVTIFLGSLEDE
jgi:hypothetical protein